MRAGTLFLPFASLTIGYQIVEVRSPDSIMLQLLLDNHTSCSISIQFHLTGNQKPGIFNKIPCANASQNLTGERSK